MIDETAFECLGGEQRRLIDQPAHLSGHETAVAGDAVDELIHHRLDDALDGFAVGGSELALGERVGGVLVLVPLGELGHDARLVERPPEERHLDRQSGDAEVAGRLQPDLVAERRQVVAGAAVVELTERLSPGDGRLARAAELLNRSAQFLCPRQSDDRSWSAGLDDEGDDSRIVGRPAESVDRQAQRRLAPCHRGAQRIGRHSLDERFGEVELEDQPGGSPASCLIDSRDDVLDGVCGARQHAIETRSARAG